MAESYALALPEPRQNRPALFGTRAQLGVAGGEVEGYLALAGFDKRAGTASYALRVVNQSPHALRARMTCAGLRGEPTLAYPLDVQIAPFAVSETLLPVRVADVGPYNRAIVNVHGGDVAFSLEAPAPPKSPARRRWAWAALAGAVLTFGSAFGAASATPRILTLAAPGHTLAGSALDIPYAYAGWAAMRYALSTPDGRQIAAGFAQAQRGTLHFAVPAGAGREVVLSADVAGPFGTRHANARIAIGAIASAKPKPQIAATPRIAEFSVATSAVRAGGTVTFVYSTNARAGEIWLIDETGRLWARKAITADGTTTIAVPQGAAGREMRAVLHARTGVQDTVAAVGFTVLPGALQPETSAATAHPPSLELSQTTAAPGETITVTVNGAHGDARISLNDKAGNAVDQGDIPATQDAVTLTAPSVTGPTTYYVTASVTEGVGEQTLVRKLLVAPR